DRSDEVELLPLRRARLEATFEFLADETGGEPALAPAWVAHERGKEWNVVLDPIDNEGIEGAGLQIDGSRTRSRMRHQLGEHRIVKHGDFGALEYARVIAERASRNSALGRRAVAGEPAAGGKEVAEGVLGIHARFDRPSIELHIGLLECQLFARCNADHLFDQ